MARRACAICAILAVAAAGCGGGKKPPTKEEYLARVNAICRSYERKLARIPAPATLANPRVIDRSIARALPLVRELVRRARAVEPPPELEKQVARFFALSDQAIDELETARGAARVSDLDVAVRAILRFVALRAEGQKVSEAIGFDC